MLEAWTLYWELSYSCSWCKWDSSMIWAWWYPSSSGYCGDVALISQSHVSYSFLARCIGRCLYCPLPWLPYAGCRDGWRLVVLLGLVSVEHLLCPVYTDPHVQEVQYVLSVFRTRSFLSSWRKLKTFHSRSYTVLVLQCFVFWQQHANATEGDADKGWKSYQIQYHLHLYWHGVAWYNIKMVSFVPSTSAVSFGSVSEVTWFQKQWAYVWGSMHWKSRLPSTRVEDHHKYIDMLSGYDMLAVTKHNINLGHCIHLQDTSILAQKIEMHGLDCQGNYRLSTIPTAWIRKMVFLSAGYGYLSQHEGIIRRHFLKIRLTRLYGLPLPYGPYKGLL